MILNNYSLNSKMYPHFNFETLYIKFQEEFLKFAFFQKLILKLKNIIFYFTYRLCCLFLKISYLFFQKFDKHFKKESFYVIKRRKSFKFQIGGLTYQIKIYIYDNYVCSKLNFFYFRNLSNFYILYSLCSLMDKASAS